MRKKKVNKKSPKKEFSLKKQYIDSWNYIKDSRKYIFGVTILFFIFGLIGLFFPTPELIEEQIILMIQQLLEKTQDLRGWDLIGFILFNNVQASFLGIIFGLLIGIFPIFATIFNGYLVGYVVKIVSAQENLLVLFQLLPHGIFELPAIFISFGIGLRLGWFYFESKGNHDFSYYFINSLKVFLFVIIPLLLVASIIEGGLMTLALNG
jgi:stage II sporulation protein M